MQLSFKILPNRTDGNMNNTKELREIDKETIKKANNELYIINKRKKREDKQGNNNDNKELSKLPKEGIRIH